MHKNDISYAISGSVFIVNTTFDLGLLESVDMFLDVQEIRKEYLMSS